MTKAYILGHDGCSKIHRRIHRGCDMVNDADHIEALRKRLLNKLKDKEREVAEIQEMIRVLGDAPRILTGREGTSSTREHDTSTPTAHARYNVDLAKQIAQYIATRPYDEIINRKDMIATLKADYGVVGKNDSLYAYISSVLKKIADDKNNKLALCYKAGAGFYRTRGDDKNSELVATA